MSEVNNSGGKQADEADITTSCKAATGTEGPGEAGGLPGINAMLRGPPQGNEDAIHAGQGDFVQDFRDDGECRKCVDTQPLPCHGQCI